MGDWWLSESLVPFQACTSINVTGSTGTGKSTFVYEMLKLKDGMFTEPVNKIMYCYGIHQPLYETMEREIPNLMLHPGLPSEEEMETFTEDRLHSIIVLDDLQQAVLKNERMSLLFTMGTHHRRISVIFITQNLFGQGKNARTIALNTGYTVAFGNVRGADQISHFARQLFPGRSRVMVDAFADATRAPYGYLVIDTTPRSEPETRLRTRIFPGEDVVVYSTST